MESDQRRQDFLNWLENLATTGLIVENEPRMMLWLMDKRLPAIGQIMVHAERGGSLRFAEPPSVLRQLGDQVAAVVPRAFASRAGTSCRMPLHLRIDLIETPTGGLLSECEGVEPELFFRAQSESVIRFVKFLENGGGGAHAETPRFTPSAIPRPQYPPPVRKRLSLSQEGNTRRDFGSTTNTRVGTEKDSKL